MHRFEPGDRCMWRIGGGEYWRLEIVRKTWTLWFFPSYDCVLYEIDEDPELGILYTIPVSVMDVALCRERKENTDASEGSHKDQS